MMQDTLKDTNKKVTWVSSSVCKHRVTLLSLSCQNIKLQRQTCTT